MWRVRTTTPRRAIAAALTFLVLAAVGFAAMAGVILALRWLGAPTWVVVLPWTLPTAVTLVWVTLRPNAAILTDEDDDSWIGYSTRLVLVGAERPQALPIRILAALLLGAPVVWTLVLLTLLELFGIL